MDTESAGALCAGAEAPSAGAACDSAEDEAVVEPPQAVIAASIATESPVASVFRNDFFMILLLC